MSDWKSEAIRLWADGMSWDKLFEHFAGRFPGLAGERVRNKVRDAVRRSPEYKARQTKSNPPPTAPEHKPANGWKNGVYESDLLVKMTREDGKSPRRMLELHGLDPDDWEVVTVKNNLWNAQVHHSQVETLGSKLVMYQSKLTAKPITKTVTFADVDAYFANKDYRTPPAIEPLQYDPDGETLEIDIADLHSGLLAWAKETGASYDLSIMRDCLAHVIADNVARCKGRRFKGIILALLGDLLHVDNDMQQTTKGTFQQAEGRTPKIFTVTLDALIDAVLALGTIAPVDVAYTSGNHDGVSGWMLIKALQMAFRDDPRVSVDVSPDPQKHRLIGRTLLGLVHGDMPEKNLTGWLQVRARKMAVAIDYMEVHSGHLHTDKRREIIQTADNEGVVARTMPTIANASTWEHRSGYVSRRTAVSYVWSDTLGLREMWYSNM